MTDRATVKLKRGEGRLLKAGGLWVFDNEIASVEGTYLNGALVRVCDFDGYPMGTGFINRNSVIRVSFQGVPQESVGIQEEDGGYIQLPDCIWRSGFPAGADHR